ncbi:MAG TPA: 2Fe-2S iron-sulfur cluster-binding protein, partial [Terriglobales bacterium]|nr:2Fe-2S iron-sulfur cluster-binding protein [Terriglobales bacterium]
MTSFRRLPTAGHVDLSKPVSFTFDGKDYRGFAGDTLASALLANDVTLVGRSFKYHRPRGFISAGVEEANGLFTLGTGARTEPNIPGTMVDLVEGLTAKSQNAWPSVAFDVMAVNQLAAPLFQSGFYYKTFMGPTKGSWMFFEPFIRKAAGLGEATRDFDPDRYETRYDFCDVLVIGSGASGLAAALAAGKSGARVVLVEQDSQLGGGLLSEPGLTGWRADRL